MSEKSVIMLVRQHGLPILILLIAILSFVYGQYLVRQSADMPAFFDAARAEAMRVAELPESEAARKDFMTEWRREYNALITPKWDIHDRGLAWIIFASCLVGLVISLRLWRPGVIQALRTPHPLITASLGLATYLSFIPIAFLLVLEEAERQWLPVWGDSIGMPIFAIILVTAIGLPFAIAVLWLLANASRERTGLWVWSRGRSMHSYVVTGVACAILIGLLRVVISDLFEGPGYFLPTAFCLAYLTLAARAILVSRGSNKQKV